MNLSNIFEQLIAKINLPAATMQSIMQACMLGELTTAQTAVFLALMRAKGETAEELTIAAQVMMVFAHKVDLGENLVDIVGTGGDGKNTFNISTLSSIITAAAGARVAKHGNYSVSSRSGSADLLQEANIKLQLNDEQLKACLQETNICFLFAPHFHTAMHNARLARQELAFRTFFNLLGPLVNPARVKKQVVGVFDKHWQQPLAQVLANTGSEHALVVTSRDGMDEISIAATSDILEYHNGRFHHWHLDPHDYGCFHANLNKITVNSPQESLQIITEVLNGEKGPARDISLLNSAAAIYCAELKPTFEQALLLAADTIDSGKALRCFAQLINFSKSLTDAHE